MDEGTYVFVSHLVGGIEMCGGWMEEMLSLKLEDGFGWVVNLVWVGVWMVWRWVGCGAGTIFENCVFAWERANDILS